MSRGTTGFITKNFRATTYFWIMLVSLKDLPLVISPAIFSDAATRMTLGGLLYAAYSIPPVIALPNMDNSSNIIDVTLSFSMSLQMLMTTSFGFADAPGAVVERSDFQLTAQEAPALSSHMDAIEWFRAVTCMTAASGS